MSNIFALSNVLKESTIGEIPTVTPENHMAIAITTLNEFNSAVTDRTKHMYDALAEATSKAEENQVFESYFTDLTERVTAVIKSINESVSRFVITVDNIADANSDIINNTSILTSCNDFTFSKYTYRNINDASFPRMDPISHYSKEFDTIGTLLQELGAAASNQAKLKVIATVYNNFSISAKDDWVQKCMEDVVGSPITGEQNFADLLFSKFRESEPVDTTITKGTLYNLKVAMEDRSKLINTVVETADKLTADLQYVLDNFCEIMGGCSKNKIVVDTKTDSIRNTTYSGDNYTSNQLNIFLKSKVDQLVRLCNVYYIALSIKLDATLEYFDQCKEIINTASMNCNTQVTASSEEVPEDHDHDDDDDHDDEPEDLEPDEPMGNEGEPVTDGDDLSGDDSAEELNTTATSEACHAVSDAIRSYQYSVYELATMYEHASLMDYVTSKYVTEADEQGNSVPIWKRIINKLVELYNKFSETLTSIIKGADNAKKLVKIKEKSDDIMKNKVKPYKNQDGSPVGPKIDFAALSNINIPDLVTEPAKMKTLYESKDTFIAGDTTLSKFKPSKDGATVSSMIKDSVLDYENGYKDTADMDAVKKDYVQYILTGAAKALAETKAMTDKIEKAEKNMKTVANESVSSLGAASEYFMEFDAGSASDDGKDGEKTNDTKDGGEKKPKVNTDALANVYFSTCSEILGAKMSTIMTVFNECYSFLSWHINNMEGTKEEGDSKKADAGSDTGNAGGESKFN